MRFQMTHGRLADPRTERALFWLCWLAYVTTYLGRLNYSACLMEISGTEGWSKGEAGLIATAFFTAYGLGQLVNGIIGDRLSPRIMVSCGLFCSGLVNLLFPSVSSPSAAAVLWGLRTEGTSRLTRPEQNRPQDTMILGESRSPMMPLTSWPRP